MRSGLLGSTVALTLMAGVAGAVELEDIFPDREQERLAKPAETLVRAAFANLFELDAAMRVDSNVRRPSEEPVRTRFWIYRKQMQADEQRTLVALIGPGPELRLLERERSGALESWIFAPDATIEPSQSDYRLTDPFLGALSNRSPDEVRADLSELARGYEVVSSATARLDGVDVRRVGLRPLAARRFERVELFIARDQPLILEYRYFERGDPIPSRVAVAPRASMQVFEGHVLPGRMVYEDRIENSRTELVIRYAPLPQDAADGLFLESSFHRVPIPDVLPKDPASF